VKLPYLEEMGVATSAAAAPAGLPATAVEAVGAAAMQVLPIAQAGRALAGTLAAAAAAQIREAAVVLAAPAAAVAVVALRQFYMRAAAAAAALVF
jgi:hypothetical protein